MTSFFWYVLHSHPKKEAALLQYIVSQEIEAYLPLIKAYPKNHKARQYVPYFPGYLFIHVDSKTIDYSKYKWLPFSTGLVKFGDDPAIVSDHVIDSIFEFLRAKNSQRLTGNYKKGDELYIHSGAFEGYEAIFDTDLSGSQRVKVLLTMISNGKGLMVELPINQIIKKSEVVKLSITQKF